MRILMYLCLSFVCCQPLLAPQAHAQTQTEADKKEIDKLSKRIKANAWQLKKAEKALNSAHAEFTTTQTQLKALNEEVGQKRAELMGEVAQHNVTVRDILRIARHPQQAQALQDVLYNQPNRAPVLKQMQNVNAHKLENQHQQVAQLIQQQQQQQKLLHLQAKHVENLESKRNTLAKYQKTYLKKLKIKDNALAKKLQRAQPKLTQHVKVDVSEQTHHTAFKGPNPIAGFITQQYGKQDDGTKADGITFLGTPGATVHATENGRIVFSGPFRNYGWLLIVEQEEKHTIYGGLQTSLLALGDTLKKGEALGLLPNVAEPTLYYETRINNHAVKPQL